MSRSKKRSIDEIQELKRIIKDRDQTIKSLERQLKKLNNELDPPTKKKAPKKEQPKEEVHENACPTCKKGKLTTTELGIRAFVRCDKCDHKLVIKRG